MKKIIAALKGKSLTVNVNALIVAAFAILKALGFEVIDPQDPDTFILLWTTGVAAFNILVRIFKTKDPIENK
jgi:predicted outer membrane lipoprotein